MDMAGWRRRLRRSRHGVLGALCAGAVLLIVAIQLPASALTVTDTPSPVTGNSTYFDGLGAPYGGCGMPQSALETQNFVALNVYNTPGDYTFYPRPLPASQADKIGMWDNGHNCGRWVQVKISDYCTGINDGAPNQAFCRGGSWVADAYNGGVLDMLVADSCGDSNAWCRDDPYHLDLAKGSLNHFVKNGVTSADMYPNHFNNRHITWSFIPAPSYAGDLQIGFMSGAQQWWPAIALSHLPNGVHGVEYFANGTWQQATMNADMGQSYIIGGTTTGGSAFQIRVRDAADTLVNGGRVYSFSLPASCAPCGPPYTQVGYTTAPPTTGAPTTVPAKTVPPTTGAPTTVPPTTVPPTTGAPPTTVPPTTGAPATQPAGSCSASFAVASSWPSGSQVSVTVKNAGSAPSNGWAVTFTLPGTQQISSSWSAVVSQASQQVVARNVSYNGALAAGGTTTWGAIIDGTSQPPINVACTFG